MEIDGFQIEVQRNGEKTRLKVQGGTHGVALNMDLPELENFALLLAHHVGLRRDELIETEAKLT